MRLPQSEYTVDPSQETLTDPHLGPPHREATTDPRPGLHRQRHSEAGYSILSDQVGASSTGIGNAREPQVHQVGMENKKGKVSPMLPGTTARTYLIALAVMDKYDDYMPASSPAISQQLKAQARNNKKAEKLHGRLPGQSQRPRRLRSGNR